MDAVVEVAAAVAVGLSCGKVASHCSSKLLLMGDRRNALAQCLDSSSAISLGSLAKLSVPSSMAPMEQQLPNCSCFFSCVSMLDFVLVTIVMSVFFDLLKGLLQFIGQVLLIITRYL